MKRFLSILLSLTMLVTAGTGFGLTARADSYGDYDYQTLVNGTVEITAFYGEQVSDVAISIPGKEISSIGDHAFHNYIYGFVFSIVTVDMPPTVTNIGTGAFFDCTTMQSIHLSENLERIGSKAFYNCSMLPSVDIPAKVESIGSAAFSGCDSLLAINVDAANTHYASEDGVLYNKNKTELMKLPGGKTGKYLIPDTVTKIDKASLFKTKLSTLVIPASVQTIEESAVTDNSMQVIYLGSQADWNQISIGANNELDDVIFHTEHSWNNGAETAAPTCTAAGETTYTCTVCGATRTEAIGALGHNWGEWSTTQEASATEAGEEKRVCSRCGAEETRAIPPYGIVISVKAADNGSVFFDNDEQSTSSKVYLKGEEYKLRAVPDDGAKFVGWYINNRLMTDNAIYTNVAYANLQLTPIFAKKETSGFTVVIYNKYGDILFNDTVTEMTQQMIPAINALQGYTPAGTWTINGEKGKTDADILALTDNATIWAEYNKAEAGQYTVTVNGDASFTLPAGVDGNSITVPYNTKATVYSKDAAAWKIGDRIVAYGESYTFYVGANMELTPVSDVVQQTPTVTLLEEYNTVAEGRYQVVATQALPEGWTLQDRGFVYGLQADVAAKEKAGEETFDMNALPADRVRVYRFDKNSTADQFALTVGISPGKTVRFYAFITVGSGDTTKVVFSDKMDIAK